MDAKRFNKIVADRCLKIVKTLAKKQGEYARQDDVLHNFERAGAIQKCRREQALKGMWVKHLVSVMDIIDNVANGKALPTRALLDEKIGDTINYAILLEAMIIERIENQNR